MEGPYDLAIVFRDSGRTWALRLISLIRKHKFRKLWTQTWTLIGALQALGQRLVWSESMRYRVEFTILDLLSVLGFHVRIEQIKVLVRWSLKLTFRARTIVWAEHILSLLVSEVKFSQEGFFVITPVFKNWLDLVWGVRHILFSRPASLIDRSISRI